MAFEFVQTLIPSTSWEFSEPVEGTFFQLRHITSDLPFEYFKGEICQAEIDENGEVSIFEAQPLDVQAELDVIELRQPPIFTNRRIGIRRHRENINFPPAGRPLIWEIQLSVSDYVSTETTPIIQPWKFLKQDTMTVGNWGGMYGSAGYLLFNWNYGGNDVASVPTYFNGYTKTDAIPYNFSVNDQRALPNNPQNTGERRSALLYGTNPTVEVFVSEETVRKVSLYLCDFDNSRNGVQIKIESLASDESAERLITAEDYNKGIYCQFSYSGSFRISVGEPTNINNILSALFFD